MCYLLCFKPKEINWLYIIHFNTVHEYIKLHITGHISLKALSDTHKNISKG
jgi:hypothetical protein